MMRPAGAHAQGGGSAALQRAGRAQCGQICVPVGALMKGMAGSAGENGGGSSAPAAQGARAAKRAAVGIRGRGMSCRVPAQATWSGSACWCARRGRRSSSCRTRSTAGMRYGAGAYMGIPAPSWSATSAVQNLVPAPAGVLASFAPSRQSPPLRAGPPASRVLEQGAASHRVQRAGFYALRCS